MKKIIALLLPVLLTLPVCAGPASGKKVSRLVEKVLAKKQFKPQLKEEMRHVTYSPHQQKVIPLIENPNPLVVTTMYDPFVMPAKAPQEVLGDMGVSLSDGKSIPKAAHSIVPSAVTVLGSPAIARSEERTIMKLRERAQTMSTSEYIPPAERQRWREELEALLVLRRKADPTPVENLMPYLTHQVPLATFEYLQNEYTQVVNLIEKTHKEILPKVVYSFLQNEGRPFTLEERNYINTTIYNVRSAVSILQKSINKDPYLLVQQKYWDRMFGAFNPLIKGFLAKPSSIFRQDNREFNLAEFALHNPDGSSPYLPLSDSMIVGESRLEDEDDDFDEEQYAGTHEALQRQFARREAERKHKAEMALLAQQEREALIEKIPAGLRIAVINDDLLPLLNMQGWAKNGFLGKDATVSTFRNGFTFMKQIRAGARYDIVITDLVLPDGGVAMMENFRILDPKAVVFASSKFYPGDGDDFSARELFNFGIDGYMWNNTNFNDGSCGYLQYLRQLNNYYYYKNKYGWER